MMGEWLELYTYQTFKKGIAMSGPGKRNYFDDWEYEIIVRSFREEHEWLIREELDANVEEEVNRERSDSQAPTSNGLFLEPIMEETVRNQNREKRARVNDEGMEEEEMGNEQKKKNNGEEERVSVEKIDLQAATSHGPIFELEMEDIARDLTREKRARVNEGWEEQEMDDGQNKKKRVTFAEVVEEGVNRERSDLQAPTSDGYIFEPETEEIAREQNLQKRAKVKDNRREEQNMGNGKKNNGEEEGVNGERIDSLTPTFDGPIFKPDIEEILRDRNRQKRARVNEEGRETQEMGYGQRRQTE